MCSVNDDVHDDADREYDQRAEHHADGEAARTFTRIERDARQLGT